MVSWRVEWEMRFGIVVLYLACNKLLLVVARGIRCPSSASLIVLYFFFFLSLSDDRYQQRSRCLPFSFYNKKL